MNPYPPEKRAEARRLRDRGLSYSDIAATMQISQGTVLRWLNPQHQERQKQNCRHYKNRHRRSCPHCGASIWMTSKTCRNCTPGPYWTRERIIHAIQQWADKHGQPPTSKQWQRTGPGHPSRTSMYGRPDAPFPTWNAAIKAAGYTPRRSSPGPGHLTWDKEEARQLRQQGHTEKEIATRMGVTTAAIAHVIGPRGERTRPKTRKHRTREQRIQDLQKALQHQ